jgi:hypothetical protein
MKPKGIEVFVLSDSSDEDNAPTSASVAKTSNSSKVRTEIVAVEEFGKSFPRKLRNSEGALRRR